MIEKKTKILFLVTKNDIGGAQKYVSDLAENLDKNLFDAKILTGGKDGIRFLSNVFLPHFLFLNDWFAIAELFFKFKKEKPDVVHLNSSKAGVVGAIAAKLAGIPKVVFTVHGWVFNPDNQLSWLRRQFYITLHQIAAIFQNKIINVSEYDRQLALKEKIAPPEKLMTVHNGLDHENLKFFDKKTARKAISKLITNYQLPITGTWVGSIGRLVTEKNYADFIRAASLVKKEGVKFFIIGDGEQHKRLKELIGEYNLGDRFFIVPNVSPAAHYLKAFDLFALSSIKEGFPYTAIEAMLAELPIVATRVGGLSEMLNDRAILMPPREPSELARAINHLLENANEAKVFAEKGKLFAKEKLSLKNMLEKTTEAYLT